MAGINCRRKNPVHDTSGIKGSNLKNVKASIRHLQKQPFSSRMGTAATPKHIFGHFFQPVWNGTEGDTGLHRGSSADGHHLPRRLPVFAKHVAVQKPSGTPSDSESTAVSKDLRKFGGDETRVGVLSVDEILATSNLAGLPPGFRAVLEEQMVNGQGQDSIVNSDEDIAEEGYGWSKSEGVLEDDVQMECYVLLSPQGRLDWRKGTLEQDETKNPPGPLTTGRSSSSTPSGWQEQGTLASIHDDSDVESFGSAYDRMSDAREDELEADCTDNDDESDTGRKSQEQQNVTVTGQEDGYEQGVTAGNSTIQASAPSTKLTTAIVSHRNIQTHETSRYFPILGVDRYASNREATEPTQQPYSGASVGVDSAIENVTTRSTESPSFSPPTLPACLLPCAHTSNSRPCLDARLRNLHSQYQRSGWDIQAIPKRQNEDDYMTTLEMQQPASIWSGTQEYQRTYDAMGRERDQEVDDSMVDGVHTPKRLKVEVSHALIVLCFEPGEYRLICSHVGPVQQRPPSVTSSELTETETNAFSDFDCEILREIEGGESHHGKSASSNWSKQRYLKSEYSLEREAWRVVADDDTVEDGTDVESEHFDGNGEKTGSHDLRNHEDDDFHPRFRPRVHRDAIRRSDEAMEHYLQYEQLAHWENSRNHRWTGQRQSHRSFEAEDDIPFTRPPLPRRTFKKARVTTESSFARDLFPARHPLPSQIDMWKQIARHSRYQGSEEEREFEELEELEMFGGDVGKDEDLLGEDGLPYQYQAVAMVDVDETEFQEPIKQTCTSEQAIKEHSSTPSETLIDSDNSSIMDVTGEREKKVRMFEEVVVIYNYPDQRQSFDSGEKAEESGRNAGEIVRAANAPVGRLNETEVVQDAILYLESLARGFAVIDREDDAGNADESRIDEGA
ncbi:hypothetical protein QFC22_004369 [Naganishia vaughanmartiniae]|uniref:Uncharacterized protein n=1 Tax=Naganishia vaughanmartiniae TaxID=1424756 RepID=A0ACC2X0E1_9TREE|nr:hypothetical protein QFC22_004369 [Naganishia vaughanmartiniae]